MNYSEDAYFDGFHVQHIADWIERARIMKRKHESMRAAGVRGR